MDSSLTALWVAGWDFSFSFNSEASSEFEFKPVELRPQGHDIIRTWAFYSVLRSIALTNKIPWRTIIINGMVLGEDGYKMSKSRNNIIPPEDVIQKFGADVFRQWAAVGGAVGSDVQFRWKDIVAARRFMQKLWSILRFSMIHLSSAFECKEEKMKELNLRIIDKWLLSKLNRLVASVTDSMENFKFDEAMKSIRSFIWDLLADDYIELVKSRLYGRSGDEGKEPAKYTLYETIKTLSTLLAPFIPFFAEEMHSCIARGSVHEEKWPEMKHELIDPEVEKEGDLIAAIARAVRRYKSTIGIPLNAPLHKIEIYTDKAMRDLEIEDIENATATKVEICGNKSKGVKERGEEVNVLDVNVNVNGVKVVVIN
jgi:valyl-tRNA synthetase